MTGIIAKAVRGAAAAGVPMLMEEHRAQIMAKRDERLQSFTAGQNKLTRDQQATQHGEEMGLRRDEQSSTATYRTDSLALQREGQQADATYRNDALGLQRDQLDQTTRQIDQQLEIGQFTINEARQLQGIRDVITNPESGDEDVQSAVDLLSQLKGNNPDKYQAITLYGDENEYGVQSRSSGILNTRSGQLTGVGPGSVGGSDSSGGGETGFQMGETYTDADGNSAVYKGKDDSGNDIWDDGSGAAPAATPQQSAPAQQSTPQLMSSGIINRNREDFRVTDAGRGAAEPDNTDPLAGFTVAGKPGGAYKAIGSAVGSAVGGAVEAYKNWDSARKDRAIQSIVEMFDSGTVTYPRTNEEIANMEFALVSSEVPQKYKDAIKAILGGQ